jgi:hypothetical protein
MNKSECFGKLERVFPLKTHGLREVPAECFSCADRVVCLRTAIDSEEGISMRVERLDQTSLGGFKGRLRRWSEKKELNRKIEKKRQKRVKWWK